MTVKSSVLPYKLPKLWLWLLSVSLFFYVIQPWSFWILGVPIQLLIVLSLAGYLALCRTNLLLSFASIFSPYQWLLISLVLTFVTINVFSGVTELARLLQVIAGIFIAILSAIALLHYKYSKYVYLGIAMAALLSSTVVIIQYLGLGQWSWGRTAYAGYYFKQPSGLEFSPVSYAYSVVAIGVVGFIAAWTNLRSKMNLRMLGVWVGGCVFILVLIGLLLSKSRSGVLALMLGLLVIALGGSLLRIKILSLAHLVIATSLVVFLLLMLNSSIISNFVQKVDSVDRDMRSGQSWSIFLPVILKYPMGLPEELYNNLLIKRSPSDPRTIDIVELHKKTNGYAPHNILLTVGLFMGLPVLVCLILFYLSLFFCAVIRLCEYSRHGNKLSCYKLLVFFAINLSLVTHAWFHNSSIFYGEMRGWVWIGAMLALIKFDEITQILDIEHVSHR